MIFKLALIVVLLGIVFLSGLIGKRFDEMNDCIMETHKMVMQMGDKIEKLEKEKMNDHS